jgi:hypothetical protein
MADGRKTDRLSEAKSRECGMADRKNTVKIGVFLLFIPG